MTPDQKQHAIQLLESGRKDEATGFIQQTLGVDHSQAKLLANKLEEELPATIIRKKLPDVKKRVTKGSPLSRWLGRGFLVVGVGLLALAVYFIVHDYQFAERADPVIGTVVNYESYYSEDSDGGGSTMYTPVFAYTYNGETLTHTGEISSSSQDYYLGEEIEILVDPEDPDSVLVNTFWDRWFVSLVLGILGVIFAGVGYVTIRVFG